MAFQTNKSRMAIVEETTEGTPVAPSASTDYIAIQEGFSLQGVFEQLENAELTGSIGQAAPVLGFETPTADLSHYIRHSGVEGQAPNFKLLLKASFGSEAVRSTERDVVSATAGTSSAQATVTVDTGEGVEFQRGNAVLIKDLTNGYNIRPVDSISGDVLTLGFNLSNAPAASVNLGKDVLYYPSESHPTLSVWDYRANEAAIQVMAGSRVTELVAEVTAGDFLNGSFSLEGINFSYNAITIDATNFSLDFDDGGGEENASITQKTYKDPIELATEIQTKMDALTGDNITVTYNNSDGKYTIASDGGTLSLLWNTGTNTATTIGGAIGFAVAADDTGATSYEGDSAITLTSPQTPSFDSQGPLVGKNNEVYVGDFDDFVCFSTQSMTFTVSNEKTDELDVCSESGKSGSVITGRTVTAEIVANISKHDADKFNKFHKNDTVKFQYNFGTKDGSGNWEAGKSGMFYIPTGKISEYVLDDADGLVVVNMTVTAFVSNSLGEAFLAFV